jgi:hypothetical protein
VYQPGPEAVAVDAPTVRWPDCFCSRGSQRPTRSAMPARIGSSTLRPNLARTLAVRTTSALRRSPYHRQSNVTAVRQRSPAKWSIARNTLAVSSFGVVCPRGSDDTDFTTLFCGPGPVAAPDRATRRMDPSAHLTSGSNVVQVQPVASPRRLSRPLRHPAGRHHGGRARAVRCWPRTTRCALRGAEPDADADMTIHYGRGRALPGSRRTRVPRRRCWLTRHARRWRGGSDGPTSVATERDCASPTFGGAMSGRGGRLSRRSD